MTSVESINGQIKALESEKDNLVSGRRLSRNWADPEKRATRIAEIAAELTELHDQKAELIGKTVKRAMRF